MYYLLKWTKFSVKKNKTLKIILEKWQEILEKSGGKVRKFCQSGNVGTLCVTNSPTWFMRTLYERGWQESEVEYLENS